MKESFINRDRAIIANDQSAEVTEPGKGAFHLPATPVSTQRSAILGARLDAIPAVGCYQFDPACCQPLAQRVAVVGAISAHTLRFLPWPSAAMSPGHVDRRERFFREPDLVRGWRVKLLSQRNTSPSTTTIHFVPLPRLVFPTLEPLFSLEQNCPPEMTRSSRVARVGSVRPRMRAKW